MNAPQMNHGDIRELLDDAVADVEPRRGLSDISARTGRARRSGLWGTAGAVVATAAVIVAVSVVGGLPGTTGTSGNDTAAQAPAKHDDDPVDPDANLFITTPADGATVSSPFTVSGKAAAYEGNVQWELKQGSTVVRRGFTTTKVCCRLSPYSFAVTAPPGTYTLVVHDENVGEGPPPARDTAQVWVQ
jgi:immunoglobulin-like protein involved in spore germination